MEAWRRELDGPVSAFPISKAGPAHIATLKTFDPPLTALEGRRLSGAERRAKRMLFPTEDGELVLLVHLMTAGRLRYLLAGEKRPKTPAFRLAFEGGAELILTEAGKKKRAGVWLLTPEAVELELGHLGPEANELDAAQLGEILAGESRRLHSLLRDQRVIAGWPRVGERDPPCRATVPLCPIAGPGPRTGPKARGGNEVGARTRPGAARARRERREDIPRAQEAGGALLRVRHADRTGRLRGAPDLLLPRVPDGRAHPQGPEAVAAPALRWLAPLGVLLLVGCGSSASAHFTVKSRLVGHSLEQAVILPSGDTKGRPLLVLL